MLTRSQKRLLKQSQKHRKKQKTDDDNDSDSSLDDFIIDDLSETSSITGDSISLGDDDYDPEEDLIQFDGDNIAGLEVIKKNDTEVYNKLVEVRDYLNNKFPNIKELLKSELKIQDKSKLLELYEILSVTPAPSQEWVFLRDHINKYFKKYKSEYKVYKKYIKEESKYKELAQNLEESTTSLASLKYKILGLNASDSAKKILYSKYLELEDSEKRDEEFNKLKKWLNVALELPFNNVKKFSYKKGVFTDFLKSTLKKLDDNLYGMSEIKEQILLFINSKLLNPDMKGCCLGLIGPPGTGKTSIARIIAEVLEYPFDQISFGGVTNTEFIKGHDFTYIGSQPGAIAKSLSRMKYKNGILFLDEYEKISTNKDIVSTLLHITDPSQNHIFRDQYLNDITIDLSAIWFIYSMNKFPEDSALKDRIYSIKVPGYSTKDKVQIVCKYFFPKYLKNINKKSGDIIVSEKVAEHIISTYTNTEEKGVRSAEKLVKDIINKINFVVNHPNFEVSFQISPSISYPVTLSCKMIDKMCKKTVENSIMNSLYL